MFNKEEKTLTKSDAKTTDTSYIHTMKDDLMTVSGKAPTQIKSTISAVESPEITNKEPIASTESSTAENSTMQTNSPFFSAERKEQTNISSNTTSEKTNQEKNIQETKQPIVTQKPLNQATLEEKSQKEPSNINWYKIGIFSIVTIIILVLVGGGYFYIMTRTNKIAENPSPIPVPIENTQPSVSEETPTVTINPESEKYSIDNPNYLSIDFESTNAEEIKNKLKSIAQTVSTLSLQSPLEFIITDKNNNPVAFPIFAMNANIKLPASLLQSLDEKFSLYIFNDEKNTRLGLAVQAKDKNVVLTEILNEEKNLITDLSPLFVTQSPEITNSIFKDGKYYIFSVRYQNLTNDESLSIDYTVTDSQLVIGTSKNTLRSILDKISSEKNSQTNNSDTGSSIPECNAELANKLASCSNYSCLALNPFGGAKIKNEIIGMIDGKCGWNQEFSTTGKMECKLTSDMQQKVAASLKLFYETGKASLSVSSDGNTTSKVNGQDNSVQEALTNGQCILTEY